MNAQHTHAQHIHIHTDACTKQDAQYIHLETHMHTQCTDAQYIYTHAYACTTHRYTIYTHAYTQMHAQHTDAQYNHMHTHRCMHNTKHADAYTDAHTS